MRLKGWPRLGRHLLVCFIGFARFPRVVLDWFEVLMGWSWSMGKVVGISFRRVPFPYTRVAGIDVAVYKIVQVRLPLVAFPITGLRRC